MMRWTYVLLVTVAAAASVKKLADRVLIEVVNLALRKDVVLGRRADPKRSHTVVFARKHRGIDELALLLQDVSDPTSSKYGRHLTRQEVAALTANAQATAAIEAYLADHGLTPKHVSKYGDFIKVDAPVSTWEKLFATEFYEFTHKDRKLPPFVRSLNYSLPSSLHRHVHAVFNTAQLPAFPAGVPPSFISNLAVPQVGFTTPPLLNDVYNIGSNAGNNLTTQAVYGNLYQSLSPSDLSRFQDAFDLPVQAVASAPGGHVTDDACSNINNCIEANLDVEYIMAVAQNVPTIYYYWTGQDVWLDWITTVADMEDPPDVFSISYGSYEFFMAPAYLEAFNVEAMKLGAMGTTILAASGDDGVAGFAARVLGRAFCDYLPMFPASSPYVTAVGGTMGPESGSPEVACQTDKGGMITTGGGFSYAFPLPAWQQEAVDAYLQSHLNEANQLPRFGYPRSRRGYPDVALLANKFVVAAQEEFFPVSGTSGSCPVMAGMVSLVNAARRAEGKPTVGFLNPALYALHSAFTHDITSGENRCLAAGAPCCEVGFTATEGWDPVTGLGSINFEQFKQAMMDIPTSLPSPSEAGASTGASQNDPAEMAHNSATGAGWRLAALWLVLLWLGCGVLVAVLVVSYKHIFRFGYSGIP